jgi:hypothetical protein
MAAKRLRRNLVCDCRKEGPRRSVEYGGEIAAAAISQNSFVGRVQATAFSEAAPEGKECALVSSCVLLPRR